MKRSEPIACRRCGKRPLSKNEMGLNRKLLDLETKEFFCLRCLADYLEVTPEELLSKIEDFKEEGCKLFS